MPRSLDIEMIAWVSLLGAALVLVGLNGTRLGAPSQPVASRVVSGSDGSTTAIKIPFRSVSVLAPVGEEYLVTSERAETLVSGWRWSSGDPRLLARAFPGLAERRFRGAALLAADNVEELMVLAPTAILQWDFLANPLRRLGLPVVTVVNGEEPELLLRNIETYATLAEAPHRGARLVQRYRDAVRLTRDELSSSGTADRPRILGIGATPGGIMTLWGASNPMTRTLARAGAANAATGRGGSQVLGAEQLLALDPDIIILRRTGMDDAPSDPATFMADLRWRKLSAVKTRKVYAAPRGINVFFDGVIDHPLFLRWLAELAHPDVLGCRLREMIATAYREQLNILLTDGDLDRMLAIAANAESSGYDRFRAHRP